VNDGCAYAPWRRELVLSDDPADPGTAARRRAGYPVEVPLVAGGYLDDSVVGYWPLDGDGTDVSGSGRDGALRDGPTPTEGAFGQGSVAPDFQGNARVELPDGVMHGLPEVSFMAWVLPDADHSGVFLSVDAGPDWSAFFWDHVRQRIQSQLDLANGSFEFASADASVQPNTWTHAAVTYDGGTAALYVNGRLVASGLVAGGSTNAPGTSWLGRQTRHNPAFGGSVDDFVVLRRALSPSEVKHTYESRRPWGTPLLPAAQPDWDDVRVTEDQVEVEHELVGGMPLADRGEDLDEHVIAYWPLDGDGRDLVSDVEAPLRGTVHSAMGRFGDGNGALAFGSGSVWDLSREGHQPGEQFTLEAWVLNTGQATAGHIAGANGDGTWSLFLAVPHGALPLCRVTTAGGQGGRLATRPLSVGRWTHVACRWDGDDLRTFVDGMDVSEPEMAPEYHPAGAVAHTNIPFTIGLAADGAGGQFDGTVDEVVLHDVARSADYLHKRAHPLPRVRFLARTADEPDGGRYPYRLYALWSGDPAAAASERQVDDLLSPRNGHAGWWRFDEAAVAPAVDASTVGNHLADLGPAVAGPPPDRGAAVELDNTYVLDDRTAGEDAGRFLAIVEASRRWSCGIQDAGTGLLEVESAQAYELGGWHHLACALSETHLTLYVDGEVAGQTALDGFVYVASARPLHVGERMNGISRWTGGIDGVRVSSRPLQPEELLAGTPLAAAAAEPEAVLCVDQDDDGFDTCPPGREGGDALVADCHDGDGSVFPGVDEACNGRDDDCDGAVDEAAAGGVLTRDCYGADPATLDTGPCRGGTETCTGGAWSGECAGEVTPADERCNGLNDDCDADGADEDFALDEQCFVGDGICREEGVTVCTDSELDVECGATPGDPADAELCGNGLDDDCNTEVDEGFADGEACAVGVGACREEGELVCTADRLDVECDAQAGNPAEAEVCDNRIDDDCNGAVDDGCEPSVLGPWTETSPLPWASNHVPMAAVGGHVYVLALSDPDGTDRNSVYVAGVRSDGSLSAWRETLALTWSLRDAIAVASWDGRLYAVSGKSGPEVLVGDVAADGSISAWRDVTALPEQRHDVGRVQRGDVQDRRRHRRARPPPRGRPGRGRGPRRGPLRRLPVRARPPPAPGPVPRLDGGRGRRRRPLRLAGAPAALGERRRRGLRPGRRRPPRPPQRLPRLVAVRGGAGPRDGRGLVQQPAARGSGGHPRAGAGEPRRGRGLRRRARPPGGRSRRRARWRSRGHRRGRAERARPAGHGDEPAGCHQRRHVPAVGPPATGGKLFCRLGSASRAGGPAEALPLDTWAGWACTSDGADLTNWLDGAQAEQVAAGGGPDLGSGVLHIGDYFSGIEQFSGLLDEVRILDRVPDPAEMLAGPAPWPSPGAVHDARCGGAVVPAGWSCIPPTGPDGFVMGSPADEAPFANEVPQHTVVTTRPILVQRVEVTQAAWQALLGEDPSSYSARSDDHPVEQVNWSDAAGYANALSTAEGLEECYVIDGDAVAWPRGLDCSGYRLPTEAEWEYAARAGTSTRFWSGDSNDDCSRVGWCGDQGGTHPVAQFAPNPWGLYDVHGNVWEWVWDRFGDYGEEAVVDPAGPDAGDRRICRGGSWANPGTENGSAMRAAVQATIQQHNVGLRLARTLLPGGPRRVPAGTLTDGGRVWVAGQSADGQDLLLWRFE